MKSDDLSRESLFDLYRAENETQTQVLITGLLALERDSAGAGSLESCMRAAHSLKGAASIVGLSAAVRLSHALEDCFVAAQEGRIALRQSQIDALLAGVDLLSRFGGAPDETSDERAGEAAVDACLTALAAAGTLVDPGGPSAPLARTSGGRPAVAAPDEPDAAERALRVSAENLNRLLALAGEALVGSRWVKPFGDALQRLRREHAAAATALEHLRRSADATSVDAREHLSILERAFLECRQMLADRILDLETFDRRSLRVAERLYHEALRCRMRPFADGVRGFPRTVRDVARALGKRARLEIVGEHTPVDRDILRKLEAPLGHLLRNAVDHGLETPDERRAAGKPEEGVVRLEAKHVSGTLHVLVSDDGRGVDRGKLARAAVARGLVSADAVGRMSDQELFAFLFLPAFTLAESVTDISGRGVGLDVVQDMVKEVRGVVRISSVTGRGSEFHLQLPVTLSVVRTLLAEIGGEPYAFPLVSVVRTLAVEPSGISAIEGRQHVMVNGRSVGLVAAHEVLEIRSEPALGGILPIVVIGDSTHAYGLVVDRFLGEQELVVQSLDATLGKVRDVAAGALMDDGSPVLILDTDDLLQSIDKMVRSGRVAAAPPPKSDRVQARRKRVLVVDDSLTVRELERKLLAGRGYDVDVAVDGMDGWNAARSGAFQLVVTDIDMPRMDGIELVSMMSKDVNLRSVPVMIVSYKDREEDRRRGLDAGAARYLTKGSFHDETLVQAVVDLIGEPDA